MSGVQAANYSRLCCLLLVVVLFTFVVLAFIYYRSDATQAVIQGLTPPRLPALDVVAEDGAWIEQRWLEQNWNHEPDQANVNTRRYHHLSQGTRSLPIPYDWFIHLEVAADSPFSLLWAEQPRLAADDYLLRLGFIRSPEHVEHNPDGLPIGFAKVSSQRLPGLELRTEAVGFTCAACHTGHIVADDGNGRVEFVIEGAGSNVDLGLLRQSIGAALGQTALSSKLYPYGSARFERFASKVLKQQDRPATRLALARQLVAVVGELKTTKDIIQVEEGFGRLDALNRIGNKVFSRNIHRPFNYQPIVAPVNFPHIWTTSWFNWAQYNGSIMQPLVRNVGEALGVGAYQDVTSSMAENRFDSSVAMDNIIWIEQRLSGAEPSKEKGFSGLRHPRWPLGDIDEEKLAEGRQLYIERCQECHLPVLSDPSLWNEEYFSPIRYRQDGRLKVTNHSVLQLKMIETAQLGTDAETARVLVERNVDTAGTEKVGAMEQLPALGLKHQLCTPEPATLLVGEVEQPWWERKKGENVFFTLNDGGNISFALALGSLVEQTIEAWYRREVITDPELKLKWSGERPNCLQAKMQYKARPLDGIWATAPYLHNGSVASLRDLLCPAGGERPRFVQLGGLRFDEKSVGLMQPKDIAERGQRTLTRNEHYDEDGFFILDTMISGNRNTGHVFSEQYRPDKPYYQQDNGVIGEAFSEQQCLSMIEYLKTL
ncbi:hypothetical protein EDC56_1403 [Sinobacterium caligoides]|uniref:Cytochrome c domain-containing protein n=1 Tax=Sinobacterium caligoides TaxID=933926 RepID=A0A3N2DMG8_9GAMM|nr:di-heme-cytochrome C peroxidase [Sinobacterium caligoides]ROS00980.1 hypothetical protein EDC56_1403 [Sinobacterium caligoides]